MFSARLPTEQNKPRGKMAARCFFVIPQPGLDAKFRPRFVNVDIAPQASAEAPMEGQRVDF
eukprot:11182295-Lingulodinium_polyedra.AAC.1